MEQAKGSFGRFHTSGWQGSCAWGRSESHNHTAGTQAIQEDAEITPTGRQFACALFASLCLVWPRSQAVYMGRTPLREEDSQLTAFVFVFVKFRML